MTQDSEAAAVSVQLKRIPQSQRDEGVPCAKTLRTRFLSASGSAEVLKIGAGLNLSGLLDMHALQQSYRALVDRHEALRTVVKPQAGVQGPLLFVQPLAEQLQHYQVIASISNLLRAQQPGMVIPCICKSKSLCFLPAFAHQGAHAMATTPKPSCTFGLLRGCMTHA